MNPTDPAFPSEPEVEIPEPKDIFEKGFQVHRFPGLTKREYFISQAMISERKYFLPDVEGDKEAREQWARNIVANADALIKALEETK